MASNFLRSRYFVNSCYVPLIIAQERIYLRLNTYGIYQRSLLPPSLHLQYCTCCIVVNTFNLQQS
ncbi:hypothetical protein HOLleu_25826 [Holothuria leucospilota]|uniref:Uncharacterized protein n=1 Tax=Holothuria leucospilota TaxID=206669 RepID=A0A9Q1BT06_HOLLE|nr:hypothetical protein HOLleu_25826 [Holothuria leucospilota]